MLPWLEHRAERPSVLVGTSAGAINAAFLASRADVDAEQFLSVRGRRVESLLDSAPLRRTVDEGVGDWGRIRRNVRDRRVEALGVVATEAASGRSVVFVEGGVRRAAGRRALPPSDAVKGIDYRAAEVGVDHVLASAAIPLVFPPKRVEEPNRAAGWYLDGGTRLNTPAGPGAPASPAPGG